MNEFDIEDVMIIQEGLVAFLVGGVAPATWMKPNRAGTRAFLLTFNRELAPQYVKIPGEA